MDNKVLLVALLFLLLLLWKLVWSPRIEAARSEREQKEQEARAKREAQLAKLRQEREEHLHAIRAGAPGYILRARLDFESKYQSGGGEGFFGQEMSPLACFDYRVGKTNGRREQERHEILKYALVADLDTTLPFLPSNYRKDWGQPMSVTRFNRIYQHLKNMADLRDGRRNFQVAVEHWRNDASWFASEYHSMVNKFRLI